MDVLTCVMDGVLYTVNIKALGVDRAVSFNCQPPSYMIIHYFDDVSAEWRKELCHGSTCINNVKKYFLMYGLMDLNQATIYQKISPDHPKSQPTFHKMPDFNIMICKAYNWYRLYNTGVSDYYLYTDDGVKPVTLLPENTSIPYTYETDIIVRKENNYTHLALRDLTTYEKSNLVPCDLTKGIFTFTRWASINWIPKAEFCWTGTLSVIKETDSSSDCTFTDGTTNFSYPMGYLKKLLKYISYGKISGTFTFESIINGSHIRFIPMPIQKTQPTSFFEDTEFLPDD